MENFERIRAEAIEKEQEDALTTQDKQHDDDLENGHDPAIVSSQPSSTFTHAHDEAKVNA